MRQLHAARSSSISGRFASRWSALASTLGSASTRRRARVRLREGSRSAAVEPVAQLEHPALPRRERGQRALHARPAVGGHHDGRRLELGLGAHQVLERRAALVGRLRQRHRRGRGHDAARRRPRDGRRLEHPARRPPRHDQGGHRRPAGARRDALADRLLDARHGVPAARALVLRDGDRDGVDHRAGDRLGHGRGPRGEVRRRVGHERRHPPGRRRARHRRDRLADHLALRGARASPARPRTRSPRR